MKRRVILGVVGALACSWAVTSPASAAAGPIKGKLRVGRGTVESTNWSGYAAYGKTFTDVKGSWIQPAANCSSVKGRQTTIAAFWAGLDGYTSGTVEQTGTESDCIGNRPLYFAGYEFYPAGVVEINHPVQAGDALSAEVSQNGSTVTVTLKDATRGWTNSASEPASGLAFSSAEWIAEALSHMLTNFGSVPFSSASATDNAGQSGPINSSDWSNDKIILVNHTGTIQRAVPSGLTSNGTAFTDTWFHS
jgi:hypothetical protein